MDKTFKTKNGKNVSDGQEVTLKLSHAFNNDQRVHGIVKAFEQDKETRWEISTTDRRYPAVGFLPENVEDVLRS